jgi:hypothetical protein
MSLWLALVVSALPKDVAAYLEKAAAFAPERIAALQAGQVIARTATDDAGEVTILGAVRIRTTKEHVQLYFDEYLKYEDGESVLRVGRFSTPPVPADVERLELERGDIEALRSCKPGDCSVRIGGGMAQLQAAIDWRAQDHGEQLNRYVRQRLVDYVRAYTESGDAALVTYTDKATPVSLADQWHGLLAGSPQFFDYAPQLARYLEAYPRGKLEGVRDFVQWSKLDQGLKPVVLLTHVVLYQDPARPDRLTVALKQIYASHFYEGAFSVATVVDAGSAGGRPACFVLFVNRTRTDLLRGALGRVKRRVTSGEILKATELTLQQMQEGLEQAAGVQR